VSTSTDAYIFCGILLDEEDELPWGEQYFEDNSEVKADDYVMPEDEQEWWLSLHDMRWESDEHYTQWHKRKSEFLNGSPVPFRAINYCSDSHPMIALAIPSTVRLAERGDPTIIEPGHLDLEEGELKHFIENIKKHKIAKSIQPRWYLASHWGK
jgi:hypothetical protein